MYNAKIMEDGFSQVKGHFWLIFFLVFQLFQWQKRKKDTRTHHYIYVWVHTHIIIIFFFSVAASLFSGKIVRPLFLINWWNFFYFYFFLLFIKLWGLTDFYCGSWTDLQLSIVLFFVSKLLLRNCILKKIV